MKNKLCNRLGGTSTFASSCSRSLSSLREIFLTVMPLSSGVMNEQDEGVITSPMLLFPWWQQAFVVDGFIIIMYTNLVGVGGTVCCVGQGLFGWGSTPTSWIFEEKKCTVHFTMQSNCLATFLPRLARLLPFGAPPPCHLSFPYWRPRCMSLYPLKTLTISLTYNGLSFYKDGLLTGSRILWTVLNFDTKFAVENKCSVQVWSDILYWYILETESVNFIDTLGF
jgi:hypothetical protein